MPLIPMNNYANTRKYFHKKIKNKVLLLKKCNKKQMVPLWL